MTVCDEKRVYVLPFTFADVDAICTLEETPQFDRPAQNISCISRPLLLSVECVNSEGHVGTILGG